MKETLDLNKVDNIEIDGIYFDDAPKFCDAYIANADYDGRPMTDEELDRLNDNGEFVHQAVYDHLY